MREIGTRARRQLFPPELSVGDPVDLCASYQVRADESLDAALRIEVVAALLLRVRLPRIRADARQGPGHSAPLVWLTRPGTTAPHDLDAAWLAASRAAYAEGGLHLEMAVITPHGWVELTRR